MNHFAIIVNFSENRPRKISDFVGAIGVTFPDYLAEREEGVFIVSHPGDADDVMGALGPLDFELTDFLLILQIGNTAAQGMTTTHFFSELRKKLR